MKENFEARRIDGVDDLDAFNVVENTPLPAEIKAELAVVRTRVSGVRFRRDNGTELFMSPTLEGLGEQKPVQNPAISLNFSDLKLPDLPPVFWEDGNVY